jgi:DNA-binding HxlR family transcriptional regulator
MQVAVAYARTGTWPLILEHLDLVRRQWDLAIVVGLRSGGVRPGELLRAINAQAVGRRLTWKVMAERLRWLEGQGYLTRRELDAGETRYWLRPRACHVLAALDALAGWYDERGQRACGAGPAGVFEALASASVVDRGASLGDRACLSMGVQVTPRRRLEAGYGMAGR